MIELSRLNRPRQQVAAAAAPRDWLSGAPTGQSNSTLLFLFLVDFFVFFFGLLVASGFPRRLDEEGAEPVARRR